MYYHPKDQYLMISTAINIWWSSRDQYLIFIIIINMFWSPRDQYLIFIIIINMFWSPRDQYLMIITWSIFADQLNNQYLYYPSNQHQLGIDSFHFSQKRNNHFQNGRFLNEKCYNVFNVSLTKLVCLWLLTTYLYICKKLSFFNIVLVLVFRSKDRQFLPVFFLKKNVRQFWRSIQTNFLVLNVITTP